MQLVQGLVGLILGQRIAARIEEPGGWNIFNTSYTKIHESLTCVIDSLIMEKGRVGPTMIMSGDKKIPAAGTHYISTGSHSLGYVGLIKTYVKMGKNEGTAYYTVYYPQYEYGLPVHWITTPLEIFMNMIRERQASSIVTYRIDSTSFEPVLYSLTVKHPQEMFPHQQEICRFIGTLYSFHKGGTVLISGKRGTGKTTAAMNMKKVIESAHDNSLVTLITNFNPSQTSVDIFKLALRSASEINPYIVIVNEIEGHMQIAAEAPIQRGDRRFSHTSDRTTFHDMLDTIAGMRYVLLVLTTEKPITELWSLQDFRSFMRPGRIHVLTQIEAEGGSIQVSIKSNDMLAIE